MICLSSLYSQASSPNSAGSPDFDGNGTVGFSDFVLLAKVFGSSTGDSGFDARFDLDGDGAVGFGDFVIFAGRFGDKVPVYGGDRDVLVALYESTDGPNWAINKNWLTDKDLSTWYGVDVHNGRVTSLVLQNNRLSGRFPKEFVQLTKLTELYLSVNQLTGLIPAELGRLTNLNTLALGSNQLTGPIPRELAQLRNLESLDLGINRLTGAIPPELGQLTNLKGLYLYWNQLTGLIPAELGQLTNLNTLNLGKNQLTGPIPKELAQLTSLEDLSLTYNHLTGAIPPGLGQLTNLEALYLYWNQLTGPIPPVLGQLTNLNTLELGSNQLTGPIPKELVRLTNLNTLTLGSNQLTGPIPAELGQLINLETLDLGFNQLTGSIPPELLQLTNLKVLGLNNVQLTGPIPRELAQLRNLESLGLGFNRLMGAIPPELGQLTNLNTLTLGFNQLTGAIPAELGQLTNLKRLYLYRNQLTGSIPAELGQLTNLTELHLQLNQLTGAIPAELGHLTDLKLIDISWNQLTGSIPAELGQLTNLTELRLQVNQLTGAIPLELGHLTNLKTLSLAANQLTGPIPAELGQLTSLIDLRLHNNDGLVGPLPQTFTDLTLELLKLQGTKVCVPLTAEFQGWLDRIPVKQVSAQCVYSERDALVALYDGADGRSWENKTNWLSTRILSEWYGVTTDADGSVTRLDLQGNNLRGTIPHQLGGLSHLKTLNLASNAALFGPLPVGLTRLSLDSLALDGTQLCAPPQAEFQVWLNGISARNEVARCADTRVDFYALMELYNGTNGSNWTTATNWVSTEPLGEWHGVTTDAGGRVIRLDLTGNQLRGVIPRHMGQLANLTSLRLDENQLAGGIPPELGQLTNLKELNLRRNRLTGPIPPELGLLTNLKELNLRRNRLTGPIPPELGLLTNLQNLILGSNKLAGEIPPELGQLTNLTELELGPNELVGPIPAELARHNNLKRLDLFGNDLTGVIPAILGQLTNLTELSLNGNNLTGSIPPELGQLERLKWLDLRSNQLEGRILPIIGRLTNLEGLLLGANRLAGPIPAELGQVNNLSMLSLYGNDLTGVIPPILGQLTNLTELSLGENQLTGGIPPELGQLNNLVWLGLGVNKLSGGIPPELGQLNNLAWLDLSVNQLSGGIPPELGRLSSLKTLNLARNGAMSGSLPHTFTGLRLETLLLKGTLLCVPMEAEFQAWLGGIPQSRVPNCTRTDVSSVYLTQATQSLEFPVPLVAGEPALLRVFVTAAREVDATIPPVRATFYLNDAEVHSVEIEGQATDIPWQVNEGSLLNSANALVPGSAVMPGLEMVVEIDPNQTLDPALGIGVRLPPTGRTPLDVRYMRPFDLTLVPFLWSVNPDSTVLNETEDLSSESDLFRLTRDILPVGDFRVTVHEPVLTSVDPTGDHDESLFPETEVIYAMEGAQGYYMGIFREMGQNGLLGVAKLSENVSLSVLDENVIAHELGHNLSLLHAPGCGAGGPDPDFPTEDGSIGTWGYDFLKQSLVIPETWDLMSYCRPQWISEFSFSRAMRHRLQGRVGLKAAAYSHSTKGLLLWGGVNGDNELFLEPAFVVSAPPSLPRKDGPYRLMGEAEDGSAVFDVAFGMAEIACGGTRGAFAFILPVQPDWSARLARVTLSGPEGDSILDDDEGPAAALLLDRATGNVRGILRDWAEPAAKRAAASLGLPEPELEVLVSRGIPEAASWAR